MPIGLRTSLRCRIKPTKETIQHNKIYETPSEAQRTLTALS